MRPLLLFVLVIVPVTLHAADGKPTFFGEVKDATTNQWIPARVYLRSRKGTWHFVKSGDQRGSTVEYNKQRGEQSVEAHTAVSAHAFQAELPIGTYTLTVESGKEYLPHSEDVGVDGTSKVTSVKLRRIVDMAKIGWYSGDTHVHRSLDELPTAMLADNLNVAFPLTSWVTKSDTPPTQGDKNSAPARAELLQVDATHVIYPFNSEYEIFTVGGKSHTLGAVFALNQKQPLMMGAPPVRPIGEEVHRQGGLLELDKHSWPWSMMLVPVMNVDLFELSNNHHWRTDFHFRNFGDVTADFMKLEKDAQGLTENAWTEFGFRTYYALLNCGFRLRPTAGTASGVHPVPLGFSRVYVHIPDGFSYEKWVEGLNAGRSFVTNGPLLEVQIDGQLPGHTFQQPARLQKYRMFGTTHSATPLSKIEVIQAGEVVKTVKPLNTKLPKGGYQSSIDLEFDVFRSTWFAVRCFESTGDNRVRFAHTAPFYVDLPNKGLSPKRVEVEYLIKRVKSEITRHTGVLSDAALQEYKDALAKYESLLTNAR